MMSFYRLLAVAVYSLLIFVLFLGVQSCLKHLRFSLHSRL